LGGFSSNSTKAGETKKTAIHATDEGVINSKSGMLEGRLGWFGLDWVCPRGYSFLLAMMKSILALYFFLLSDMF